MESAETYNNRFDQLSGVYRHLLSLHNNFDQIYQKQKIELIEYKNQAHYWAAQFQQLKTRENDLQNEVDDLKAQLRKREKQLFGRKSEKESRKQDPKTGEVIEKKKRGQQPNNPSPDRREYANLSEIEETVELRVEDRYCPCCKLSYDELPGTEDSEVLEIINVQAHKRIIRRKRYKRQCRCKSNPAPQIITVPPMERVFPKSKLGISIWAHVLIHKYEFQTPLHRILANLSLHGLSLSMGTVTGGLRNLLPLLAPVYAGIAEHNVSAQHWHADETGWKVFEKIDGKNSANWYLWIFHNKESVVYKISPSRSSSVLIDYFGIEDEKGILNVDRFAAYKVIAKLGVFILAFCWAHVRRDFLEYAKGYPHKEVWALAWVEEIAKLYHINNIRIQLKPNSKQFNKSNTELKQQIDAMHKKMTQELADSTLLPSMSKILKSLSAHWSGLTVFVDHPHIPMDNNTAERGLRPSVVGRKNYYGSGSVWSAELTAIIFTILNTVKLWGINPHTWLLAYLYECAMLGGCAPDDISRYLPWNMQEETLKMLSEPPRHEHSSDSS